MLADIGAASRLKRASLNLLGTTKAKAILKV